MDLEDIYPLICKSAVRLFIDGDDSCGIIIACKAQSAYVIADAGDYRPGSKVKVEFNDGTIVPEKHIQCYPQDDLLGISCQLVRDVFDQDMVKKVDVYEDDADADLCEEVYVYDIMAQTITEGHAMKVDAHQYVVTNIATLDSEYGSPVVKKDGRLIGMCSSFEHHLTARNMVSIADSIERSHNREFTTVVDTMRYLDMII